MGSSICGQAANAVRPDGDGPDRTLYRSHRQSRQGSAAYDSLQHIELRLEPVSKARGPSKPRSFHDELILPAAGTCFGTGTVEEV